MDAIEEGRIGALSIDDILVFRTMVLLKTTPPAPPPTSDEGIENNPFLSFAESFLNMSAKFAPSQGEGEEHTRSERRGANTQLKDSIMQLVASLLVFSATITATQL